MTRRTQPWRGSVSNSRGQSLIEYAVLVAAVIVGVIAAAHVSYRAFVGHAQTIERDAIVF